MTAKAVPNSETSIIDIAERIACAYPIITNKNIGEISVKLLVNFDDAYEHIKYLGNGSYGTVSVYRERTSNNLYAFKEIDIIESEDIKEWDNEVNILKKLSSKNSSIVQYHDSFVYKRGNIYTYVIVTEYIDGFTLEEYVSTLSATNATASERFVLNFSIWLFSTLTFIHQEGYVHRDIKPGNIMFDTKDNRFVLLDFGLTCSIEKKLGAKCNPNKLTGTPVFISPELWNIRLGKDYRSVLSIITNDVSLLKKSDVWSAGLTIFYLCEKKVPWEDSDNFHKLRDEITGFSTIVCTDCSYPVKELLHLSLIRDPNRRASAELILSTLKFRALELN